MILVDSKYGAFRFTNGATGEVPQGGVSSRSILTQARELKLTSDEHCTVDGTLIEAWASLKSLHPKGEERSYRTPPDDPGNPSVDFHGEQLQNATGRGRRPLA